MGIRAGVGGLAVAAALVASVVAAGAQQEGDFVDLTAVVESARSAEATTRLLFFPLDPSFDGCVPLRTPCPQDSSSLMLVSPAARRLTWQPEGADLHVVALDGEPLRAIGTAPERSASVRYLVPVLEGSGIQLVHVPHRYVDGRLVHEASSDGAGSSVAPDPSGSVVEAVTPVLGGSVLSTAPPAAPPDRLLGAPAVIHPSELVDAAPALLVRRSSPSRVVFGLRPDPDWNLETDYLALLDEGVVARSGRFRGTAGLAVTAPPGVDEEALDRVAQTDPSDTPSSERRRSSSWAIGALLGGLALTGAGVTMAARRARARRRRADAQA